MSLFKEKVPKKSLGRTWHQARTFSKILLKTLEEKIGYTPDHKAFAEALTRELGDMKGPIMKIGQILATVPGMLPPAYSDAFLSLSTNAPPMGPLFVKRRMVGELGQRWASLFKTFHLSPSFAASLGQIHKAQSHKNETLAVKLQYPNMEAVIETDLKHLRFVCRLYERYGRAILTENFQKEIRDRLYEELDYQREAKHITWFQKALKDEKGVSIPKVYPALSTKRLLTMSWMEGEPLLSFREAPQKVREKIARQLFRAWWLPFYQVGLLHGDPHLGNYTVCPSTHMLNLLDFGCVRVFKPKVVEGIVLLFQGLRAQDAALMKKAYGRLGFTKVSGTLMETLNLWASFLYEPLLDDRVRPIAQDLSGGEGREVAEKVHSLLREQGGIMPPREFVFLDRAAVGIGSALMRLDVQLNWHALFMELIQDFDVKKLERKQKALTTPVPKKKVQRIAI